MEEGAACFPPESFGVHLSGRRNFLRLELLLRSPAAGQLPETLADPFVRVRGDGGGGSLYLARLRSNDGALDRFAVVKLLADGRVAPGRRPPPAGDNPFLVRVFQDEYRTLRLLRETDPDAVVRLAPFDLKTGGGVELPRHLPLIYCKRRRLFFTPRCERCAGPLRDCQDDALLLKAGLRPYTTSGARYLHCPSCAKEGAPLPSFFGIAPTPGEAGLVGDAHALMISFGELARRGPAGITEFPCAECPSTSTCYPAQGPGEAVRLLVPFSFHDFFAFVHESLPLHFDEACDLIGGRSAVEVLAGTEAQDADRSLRSAALLFRSDPDGREILEVLLLKLALCRELFLGVMAVHDRFARPHGNLDAASVWVGSGGSNLAIPGAWDLRVRVTPPHAGATERDRTDLLCDVRRAGLLALGALLGSRAQPRDAVEKTVIAAQAALGDRGGAEELLAALPAGMADSVHLLWEPSAARETVPAKLWRSALLTALELATASASGSAADLLGRGAVALSDVGAEVRRALFFDQPRRGEELHAILEELLRDPEWLSAVAATRRPEPVAQSTATVPPAPAAPAPSPAVDFEATVILGRPLPQPPPAPAPSAAPAAVASEDLEATMIAGAASPRSPSSAPPAPLPDDPGGAPNLDETVILPAQRKPGTR